MSLITLLPPSVVTSVVQKWLWLLDVRALDNATCNRTDRILVLSVFKSEDVVLRGCPILRGPKLKCFVKWIIKRKVRLWDIRFSSTPNRRSWPQLISQIVNGVQVVQLCFRQSALSPDFMKSFNSQGSRIQQAELSGLKSPYLLVEFVNDNRLSLRRLFLLRSAFDFYDFLHPYVLPNL